MTISSVSRIQQSALRVAQCESQTADMQGAVSQSEEGNIFRNHFPLHTVYPVLDVGRVGGNFAGCSQIPLHHPCRQRALVIGQSDPKENSKKCRFPRLFCVRASALEEGWYRVISPGWMGRPELCLPLCLLTQVLFCAPHLSAGMHQVHSGLSNKGNVYFPNKKDNGR